MKWDVGVEPVYKASGAVVLAILSQEGLIVWDRVMG